MRCRYGLSETPGPVRHHSPSFSRSSPSLSRFPPIHLFHKIRLTCSTATRSESHFGSGRPRSSAGAISSARRKPHSATAAFLAKRIRGRKGPIHAGGNEHASHGPAGSVRDRHQMAGDRRSPGGDYSRFHITPEDRQAPPRHLLARALAKEGPEPSISVLHHLI